MKHVPALDTLPPGVVTLEDHARHAQTHLDDNAWAYFSGGAGDEITLRANRAAWDRISLNPRVLRAMAGGSTRVELLGHTLAHPILLAPWPSSAWRIRMVSWPWPMPPQPSPPGSS